jgi:hypothetical protein
MGGIPSPTCPSLRVLWDSAHTALAGISRCAAEGSTPKSECPSGASGGGRAGRERAAGPWPDL